jgi:hypothetical protein
MGSGKGAVGDLMVANYGFIHESFARSVKDAAAVIFGWDREMLEGVTPESRKWREEPDSWWSSRLGKPFSPRYALQLLGTEAGRDVFDTNLWVYSIERRIDPNKNYVITDVRFPNELDMIRKMGGVIIRVKRGDDPEWYETALEQNHTPYDQQYILEDRKCLMEQKYPNVHFSEWAWIGHPVDGVFHNNGKLENLSKAVDFILKDLYNVRYDGTPRKP